MHNNLHIIQSQMYDIILRYLRISRFRIPLIYTLFFRNALPPPPNILHLIHAYLLAYVWTRKQMTWSLSLDLFQNTCKNMQDSAIPFFNIGHFGQFGLLFDKFA